MSALVTCHQLKVQRRGRTRLGPLDLTFAEAGTTVIMGPNGAGKTTLLRALHGIERHQGALNWKAEADTSIVFQTPIVLRRSVAQNLEYPLALRKIPKPQRAGQVAHWAERVGLGAVLERSALRLSGGEKQKLALARSLITEPQVLLLDEPCASLDPSATREIEALLHGIAERGTRIIMATHDLGQARRLARDVIVLHRGQVLESGPAPSIFSSPAHPQTAAFIAGDLME